LQKTSTGFNSATALKPWKPAGGGGAGSGSKKLQFGHGVEAVETTKETAIRNGT